MDLAVIVTYRCNSRCTMCGTWRHPSKEAEEFSPDLLRKLPGGFGRLNITGGEPALRRDLGEICDILAPKAERLEISTNGYFTDRLVAAARAHPGLTVRISVEGVGEVNDRIRGVDGGFERAVQTFDELRAAGVSDLGFAVVVQDANAEHLLDLYRFVAARDAEFATAMPHNGFYFHTEDNRVQDVAAVQGAIRGLVAAFLRSRKPKQWFRAYLAKGLIDYVGGAPRPYACTAGRDIVFLDPFGEVYPCNGRALSMGNLHEQTWDEIMTSEQAHRALAEVDACTQRCWMTGTAVPAMRKHLPAVTWWVGRNKLRVALGRPVDLRG